MQPELHKLFNKSHYTQDAMIGDRNVFKLKKLQPSEISENYWVK